MQDSKQLVWEWACLLKLLSKLTVESITIDKDTHRNAGIDKQQILCIERSGECLTIITIIIDQKKNQ